MAMNVTNDQLINILKHYHRGVYREITDYDKAVDTLEEIIVNNNTIYKFTLPFQNIYLNADGYAVTYQEQSVENNNVYYQGEHDDWGEYINKYEWLKTDAMFPGQQYWGD